MAPLSPGLACVRQWGDHNVTPDPRPFFVPSRFELSKLRKKKRRRNKKMSALQTGPLGPTFHNASSYEFGRPHSVCQPV